MTSVHLSETTNLTTAELWQVLIGFEQWPEIFNDLERVRVVASEPPDITLQSIDSKGGTLTQKTVDWQPEKRLQLIAENLQGSRFRELRQTFTLQSVQDKCRIDYECEFEFALPLVGAWLNKLTDKESMSTQCQHALDNVIRKAREKKFTYKDTVQTILNRKGNNVISALPQTSVAALSTTMNDNRIGTILIIDEQENLVGLVSERDIVYQISARGEAVLRQHAKDIMTRDLIICEPQSDLLFVMACMTDNKIRHLPVMDGGRLQGIISIGDVVKQRIDALEAESETLREYIAARDWGYHAHHTAAAIESVPVVPAD